MSTVQLRPHFVAARDYADVCSVLGLLKEPIDDEDFETPEDAPYMPATYTSTIHLSDTLSVLSTGPPSPRRRSSALAAHVPTVHVPFGGDVSAPRSRAPDGGGDDVGTRVAGASHAPESTPFTAPRSPKASPTVTNGSRLRLTRCPSSTGQKPRRPKVLCIWDVDDTLVASGVSGVRQNLVFRESELVALFRSAGDDARHLLLSQGSIDDVFEEPSGRLRCVRPFLQRASEATRRSAGGERPSSAPLSSNAGAKKEKSSFSDLLRCGGGNQAKEPPSSASSVAQQRGGPAASSDNDLRRFAAGTVLVRLAALRDRSETAEDAAFLRDPAASPTCQRVFDGQLDDKAERLGRWLVLRPEVWGITLASMNTFFPPSRHTAYVNGKIYRKMDVVWSLAMTGEWDSIFFIDNNLSEVGVVRYGLQMTDVLDLRSQRKVYRLFQSDYLLLAASAKLRELELRYGRDITKPPPASAAPPATAAAAAAASHSSAKGGPTGASGCHGAVPTTATTSTAAASTAAPNGGGGAEETGALTPSKSAATSSTGSADRAGGFKNSALNRPAPSARQGDAGVADDVHIVSADGARNRPPPPPLTATKSPATALTPSLPCNGRHSIDVDNLSLTSASSPSQHPSGGGGGNDDVVASAMLSFNSIVRSPKLPCKDVDLIVVNLHMPSDAYHRVLTTARTNTSGQRSMQRVNNGATRYVGQPVFVGDRSCTDDQYKAILKYFQEAESTLFQLIEEEMRANGFVDASKGSRWVLKVRMAFGPKLVRPTFVPHMHQLYTPFLDDVEERLAAVLQRVGGTSSSCVLHTEAQRQYYVLQRVLPLIDPYLTGDLGRMLFDIFITDGSIPKSLADQLKRSVARMRARLQPPPEKKKR
ncbi:hypothetical protein NESM_000028700 [Novymonas esmeraldas]|uniref:Uncharacterized protein n=1 Tax=Novymonas esmeraldas TaxID=1808958 RepID=A0AAW0F1Q9_9TRYP